MEHVSIMSLLVACLLLFFCFMEHVSIMSLLVACLLLFFVLWSMCLLCHYLWLVFFFGFYGACVDYVITCGLSSVFFCFMEHVSIMSLLVACLLLFFGFMEHVSIMSLLVACLLLFFGFMEHVSIMSLLVACLLFFFVLRSMCLLCHYLWLVFSCFLVLWSMCRLCHYLWLVFSCFFGFMEHVLIMSLLVACLLLFFLFYGACVDYFITCGLSSVFLFHGACVYYVITFGLSLPVLVVGSMCLLDNDIISWLYGEFFLFSRLTWPDKHIWLIENCYILILVCNATINANYM